MLQIFSVYDTKLEAYNRPAFIPTKGLAIRGFTEAVNDPQNELSKYPQDYVFFHLGSFDEQTGLFDLFAAPVSMGVGIEFVKPVDSVA